MKYKLLLMLVLLFGGPLYILLSGQLVLDQHWSRADRSTINIALDPKLNKEVIVQIYAARAYGWRGMFAVHSWIAIKQENAKTYTIYQVIGWNKYLNRPVLDVSLGHPDRKWYGHKPWVLYEVIGNEAERVISEIQSAVKEYPYKNKYRFWPGPNSNSFISYVIRHSPSIKIRMPLTAIGKDYKINSFCSRSVSKTGYQCSFKGLLGLTVARIEGVEINVLGFSFSINTVFPYIHLPGID